MKKIFIKRNVNINEDINITDPTLASQYLAVKKQISDKKLKVDQQTKLVNQTNNEINILEKNLIAIETKANTKPTAQNAENNKTTTTSPKNNTTQQQQTTQTTNQQNNTNTNNTSESLNENIGDYVEGMEIIVNGKRKSITNIEKDYRPKLDIVYLDGKPFSSVWLDKQDVNILSTPPKKISKKQEWKEILKREEKKEQLNQLEQELIDLKREKKDLEIDMEQDLAGYEETNQPGHKIFKPKPKHDIYGEMLNNKDEEILQKEKEIEEMEKELYESMGSKISSLDTYREDVISAIDDVFNDGETLAYEYENLIKKYHKESRPASFTANVIITMERSHSDNENYIGGDTFGKFNANLTTAPIMKENLNESVYDDMLDGIEKELSKLSDIKTYIENYDTKEDENINEPEKKTTGIWEVPTDINDVNVKDNENDVDIDINVDDNVDINIDLDDETGISDEIMDLVPTGDIEDKDYDNTSDEIVDIEDDENDPFEPSEEQKIIDETLKVEDKEPFISNLVEQEDLETELNLMNYEDEDEPKDEYVFHVKINADTDSEIIAKVYKENEDDDWEIRVVKGDEEPIESMKFDGRLNKLELIGYLADIYEEVEIMDPKEYEYLLDDKEKVDNEYYDDLEDDEENENVEDNENEENED